MKRFWSIAASILVLISITIASIWWLVGNGTKLAFADVVNQVKQVKSSQYHLINTINIPGQGIQKLSMQVIVVEPSQMRFEYSGGEGKGAQGMTGTTMIFDYKNRRAITFNPQSKIASVINMEGGQESAIQQKGTNLMAELPQWDPHAKPLGKRQFKGRPATGFHTTTPNFGEAIIWADDQTQLPVEIESKMTYGGFMMTFNYSDFQWNQSIDESLLSTTPPPGYAINNLKVDISKPTEKDLVECLKNLVEFSDGAFPDEFSMAGYIQIMQKSAAKQQSLIDHATTQSFMSKSNNPEVGLNKMTPTTSSQPATVSSNSVTKSLSPEQQQAVIKETVTKSSHSMMNLMRGLMFAGNAKAGTDWHYAGKGAKLNDPNRPILWYRPLNQDKYHVIDATLAVHEIPATEIPTIPSVKIESMVPQTQPATSHSK